MLYYIIDLGLSPNDNGYLRFVEEEVFEQELHYNLEEMYEANEMSEEEANVIIDKFNTLESGTYDNELNGFIYGKSSDTKTKIYSDYGIDNAETVETLDEEPITTEEEETASVEEDQTPAEDEETRSEFVFNKITYEVTEIFDDYGRWQIISASDINDEDAPLVYFIVETGTDNITTTPFESLEDAEEELKNDPFYNDEVNISEEPEEEEEDFIDISEEEENEVEE